MTATPLSTDSNVDNLGLTKVEKGKAPTTRLKDPIKAQQLAAKIVDNNKGRSQKNALIKGMLDGNKPFNPQKLRAAAQSWRTNVNFGEGKAAVSAANTPFYDLFTGSKFYFNVETSFGANVKERYDFSQALTEEADYMVREWEGFDFNIQAMIFDMIAFGKGFLFWLDPTDWHFEWLAHHLVSVPDNTKAHTGKLTTLVVRGEYQVHELWHKITNAKAGEVGWNVAFTKLCIENAYPTQRGTTGQNDYEAIQQRIKDNDLCEGMEASVIPVYHIFVAELTGQVSHYIVPETSMPTDGTSEKKAVEFLFESPNTYKKFSQVIATFFFETLDGSWNGTNGLGKELYDLIELKNRLNCASSDGAFLRSGITLRANDANALEKLSMVQIGAFNILPPGTEVQNSTIMGDLQGPMTFNRSLDMIISSNTGIYKPKMDKPEGNPRTAREVELNFQAGATLSNSAVNRFYLNLDRFYAEVIRRLCMDSEFKKRCKERNIPEEALKKIRCVKAHRAVGNGSPFMRQQAMARIAPLVPLMPEQGRQSWAMDSVSAETNMYTAQRYFPSTQDDFFATDHAYDATIENAILTMGAPVLRIPAQNDVIHAQIHLQFASGAAAGLDRGANPVEVLNTLDHVGAHVAVHLQHISQDEFRGNELKALTAQWQQLTKVADDLRKKIKEQAEAAAEQQQQEQQAQSIEQGTDPETRIMFAKAARDEKIKTDKANLNNALKIDAHRTKTTLADAKVANDIAMKQAQATAQKQTASDKE